MNVRLLRASYFIWVIVVLAGYMAYLGLGLPHILWSYDWRDSGQGYDPYAERFYTCCRYIGPYGVFTVHFPKDGQCDWLQFHKQPGDS